MCQLYYYTDRYLFINQLYHYINKYLLIKRIGPEMIVNGNYYFMVNLIIDSSQMSYYSPMLDFGSYRHLMDLYII